MSLLDLPNSRVASARTITVINIVRFERALVALVKGCMIVRSAFPQFVVFAVDRAGLGDLALSLLVAGVERHLFRAPHLVTLELGKQALIRQIERVRILPVVVSDLS